MRATALLDSLSNSVMNWLRSIELLIKDNDHTKNTTTVEISQNVVYSKNWTMNKEIKNLTMMTW